MMQHISKLIKVGLFSTIFLLSGTSVVHAAPSFSMRPVQQTVTNAREFTIEVLIDSDSKEIIKARAVVTFDPTLAKIVKAERNNLLFTQFPSNEQSTDNTNGVFMLTGFTQSGSGEPYVTGNSPDVFAKVTFKPLKDGIINFDWEFSGEDAPFKTVIVTDGSPPQNILTVKPASVSRITLVDTDKPYGQGAQIPVTGIFDRFGIATGLGAIAVGTGFFLISGVLYQTATWYQNKRKRTLVRYGDD